MVYMDNCAWQNLSHRPEAVKGLRALVDGGNLSFAVSPANRLELPLHGDASQTRKRVHTAQTMLDVVSREHLFRHRLEIERDEIQVASGKLERAAIFAPVGSREQAQSWDELEDLARVVPHDPALLRTMQTHKDKTRAETQAAEQAVISVIVQRKAAQNVSVSEDEIAKLVRQHHTTVCRMTILDERAVGGRELVEKMGIDAAVARVQSLRVYGKTWFFRIHCRAQWRRKNDIDPGDLYDTDHVVYGSYCDVFVSEERELRRFCRAIDEPTLKCINLRELLEEAEKLRRDCS